MIEFISPSSDAWARHWRALPRDGLVPLRSAFDPLGVPDLLPHMMICDLSEPGVVRIRLMGTGMVDSYGFDPTGRDYLDLVAPGRRAAALAGFIVPANHPCGMRAIGEMRYASGKTMAVETAGFPFRRDDGGGMQMVFVGSNIDRNLGPWPELGHTDNFHVFERDFIDIGAGVPDASR